MSTAKAINPPRFRGSRSRCCPDLPRNTSWVITAEAIKTAACGALKESSGVVQLACWKAESRRDSGRQPRGRGHPSRSESTFRDLESQTTVRNPDELQRLNTVLANLAPAKLIALNSVSADSSLREQLMKKLARDC
jgi:hypothetical protein